MSHRPERESPLILLADDDQSTRILLRLILKKDGYQVIEVENGQECLTAWQKHQPDMILLDAMMPVMDGFDCCEQLNQIEANELKIPVLMITGLNDKESVDRAFSVGATDYITKPIHPPVLRQRLARILKAAKAEAALKASESKLLEQNLRLQSELNQAADYVRSLLPKPLDNKIKIEHYFAPSSQLGGDIFDYYWLDKNHLAVYLLDVAGHGIKSALLSIAVLNILRSQSLYNTDFYEPWTVLTELNRMFQMNERGDNYFTIWYGVISLSDRELVYASAGHPPGILLSQTKQDIKYLDNDNIPIGMLDEHSFEQNSCPIATTDTLYILSDGVYEVPQGNGQLWGLNNLVKLIEKHQHTDNSNLEKIWHYARKTHKCQILDDDFSLLKITM
ncbi:MAG: SpoIIE family protein phosphatase [Cyanobacteria bacterium P01_A01_bin.40]